MALKRKRASIDFTAEAIQREINEAKEVLNTINDLN
jgi:hypothetical protein